jgi:hypothetical protein
VWSKTDQTGESQVVAIPRRNKLQPVKAPQTRWR